MFTLTEPLPLTFRRAQSSRNHKSCGMRFDGLRSTGLHRSDAADRGVNGIRALPVSVEVCPQLMFAFETLKLPVTGATTTWAVAVRP